MQKPFAGILLIAAASLAQESRFDYDPQAPLNVQEVRVERRGNVAIHDISYAVPKVDAFPAISWRRRARVPSPP